MTDPRELFVEARALAKAWLHSQPKQPAEVRRFLVILVAAQLIAADTIESIETVQGDDYDLESVYSIYRKVFAHAEPWTRLSLEVLNSNFPLPASSEGPAVASIAVAALRATDGDRARAAHWLLAASSMIRDVDDLEDFKPEELLLARSFAREILADMEDQTMMPLISATGGDA